MGLRVGRRGRLAIVLLAGCLFGAGVIVSDGADAASPPPSGGYFTTTAPGTPLTETDASCAAKVRRSPWEPRMANQTNGFSGDSLTTPYNFTVPPQPFTFGNNSDFPAAWNGAPKSRVTGNFTGTTDEIVQWAACKWGWSDEWIRAQMVQESNWLQSANGDAGASWGLLQNKRIYQPADSWPWFANSTAFGLDYSLWKLRGCWEGVKSGGASARGNIDMCWDNWWSGNWSDVPYSTSVNNHLAQKAWRGWADQSGQPTPTTVVGTSTTTTVLPVTTTTMVGIPTTTAAPTTTVPPTTVAPTTVAPTTTTTLPAGSLKNWVCVAPDGNVREGTWQVQSSPIACRSGDRVWSW